MRRTRSTEKAFVYAVILGVLLFAATGEETRTTGTPLGWTIFWIICALLAFGILKNLNTPPEQYRPARRHTRSHKRINRRVEDGDIIRVGYRNASRREARKYRNVR